MKSREVVSSGASRGELQTFTYFGGVAQLGEHLLCKQGVGSSILLASTKHNFVSDLVFDSMFFDNFDLVKFILLG